MEGGRKECRGRVPVTRFTIPAAGRADANPVRSAAAGKPVIRPARAPRALRSTILVLAALLLTALFPAGAVAENPDQAGTETETVRRVTIVAVPGGVGIESFDRLRPAAIGLLNPGLGDVPAAQTWLDVTQGARVFDRDYDRPLGPVTAGERRVDHWFRILARAGSATLPIRPGLLAGTIEHAGLAAGATRVAGLPAIVSADRAGRIDRTGPECPGTGCRFALTVTSASLGRAVRLARDRAPDELLIVVESPPTRSGGQLAVAVAGPGFRGLLRSPSTRTPGYVLSTDIAPTVLDRLGLPVPGAMTGLPLTSGGTVDYPRLEQLEGRYRQVGKRRGAALAVPLLLWIGLAAVAAVAGRGRITGPVLELLCLSVVLLPAVLLLTAALEPSLAVERAIATLLPVVVAAAAIRFLPGYTALAAACGATVLAFAIDMLAGSVLTPRAVIGPNPGLGARFYGIGNELESTLMILTSVGLGAGLTAFGAARGRSGRPGAGRPGARRSGGVTGSGITGDGALTDPARNGALVDPVRNGVAADMAGSGARPGTPGSVSPDPPGIDRQRAAAVFLVGGTLATLVFAAGPFGADAGAAIVFPVAAVIAAVLALGRPRLAWLALLAGVAGLLVIGVIDLVSGGETHFTRSVLGSGAGDGFGEVLLHRLEATADSFIRVSRLPITVVAVLLIGIAVRKRRWIAARLRPVPLLSAGIVAAAAGSVIGALTNDSGVLFIQVGVLYLGLAVGYVAGRERS